MADAGHELRTPLAVLRTELELAGHPGRSVDELREAVTHATAETERLARLADSLLFLARGEHDAVVHRADTDVGELVDRAVTAWRATADQAGIRLDAVHDDDARASVDPDLVRRAVDNLLDNALRVAPRGTTVTVRTVRAGGSLDLAVEDEGPGFPPDFLPSAFERFRRADDARSRDAGGAGLGLAIVGTIAAAHGGTVAATNRAEGGACVRLSLPRM